jgi:hypothetical protein
MKIQMDLLYLDKQNANEDGRRAGQSFSPTTVQMACLAQGRL